MTRYNVGQLVDLLSGFPADLPVVVDGYEGGLTEHMRVAEEDAVPNHHLGSETDLIFGEHGDYPIGDDPRMRVVAIHRHQR